MIESQTSYLRAATNIAMQLVAFFTCFANHKQFVSWAIFGAGLQGRQSKGCSYYVNNAWHYGYPHDFITALLSFLRRATKSLKNDGGSNFKRASVPHNNLMDRASANSSWFLHNLKDLNTTT